MLLLPLLAIPMSSPTSGVERFVGGMMGVSADVSLCMATQHAEIRLSGIPLGGILEGTARFTEGEGSDVLVEEPLRTSLRRRFVKIVDAKFDRETDRVLVTIKLPLLLGTQTIVLTRAKKLSLARSCLPLL